MTVRRSDGGQEIDTFGVNDSGDSLPRSINLSFESEETETFEVVVSAYLHGHTDNKISSDYEYKVEFIVEAIYNCASTYLLQE